MPPVSFLLLKKEVLAYKKKLVTYMNCLSLFLGLFAEILKIVAFKGSRPDIVKGEYEDYLNVIWHVRDEWKELPLAGRAGVHIDLIHL